MPNFTQGKTGYSFHYELIDPVMSVNSVNLTLTKFADNEQEALSLIKADVENIMVMINDRASKIGSVPVLSPFAAKGND